MQHAEALLMAGVLGLYLFDSALLLCANEAILCQSGNGRWSLAFGSHGFTLRGREPFLPNPFTPSRALFRLSWSFEGPSGAGATRSEHGDWSGQRDAFKTFTPALPCLAGALFLGLPVALFFNLGEAALLSALGLIYASALWIVMLLWCKRGAFGLRGKALALLILDALACPPFALNVVRKLSLRVLTGEDLADAARRLLEPADWDAAEASLLLRLDDAIANEDEAAPRMVALLARRAALVSGMHQGAP
jgi:hypothetical protein